MGWRHVTSIMTSTTARSGAVALAFLAAIALGAATTHAGADSLGCDATVHDPEELLDRDRLDPIISSVASQIGGDVRVRVEGTLDGGLDRRIDQLVEQCPGWHDADTDELADDMVVVTFSADERENSIFYGADLGPELEDRWDAATDAMIPALRTGDYTDAVIAGLRGLTQDPIGSTSSSDESSDGSGGVPGEVIFWGIVLAAIVVLSYVAKQQGWSSGSGSSWDDGDDVSTGWLGGGRRRSSFRSFGSRSRSSSGSSRRSGGGSRRAGGGSKKW
jgi:uncharacterized membrane protein YgcG